jgi:hypothetical protein
MMITPDFIHTFTSLQSKSTKISIILLSLLIDSEHLQQASLDTSKSLPYSISRNLLYQNNNNTYNVGQLSYQQFLILLNNEDLK